MLCFYATTTIYVCYVYLFPGYYNQSLGHAQSQNMEASRDMQVLVTGTTGISWRRKPTTVSKNLKGL